MALQSFKQLAAEASRVVNSTLGALSVYTKHDDTENPIQDVPIIVDRNGAVKDAIGNIIGYEITATLEKSFLPRRPDNRDFFIDDEGVKFQVHQVREETPSKWYFTVTER